VEKLDNMGDIVEDDALLYIVQSAITTIFLDKDGIFDKSHHNRKLEMTRKEPLWHQETHWGRS
jgi:hypothetical protein